MTLSNQSEAFNLAVDIGGSKTIVALAYQNKIVATKQIPTSTNGFDEFLRDFFLAFTNLCSESNIQPKSIVSAVIASPGLLDIKNGVVIRAINLDWNSIGIIESFRNLLGIENIVLESDKSCAALAEYSARKGKHKNLLYFTASTGISCAFVIGGKVWGGSNNFAGEIGQTIIEGSEIDRSKTLERSASGGAIFRDHGKLAADLQKESDEGNLDSKSKLVEAGNALGVAIFNQFQVLDPEICVVGGGLALGSDTYWQAVTDTLRSAESNSVKRRYLVERSFLGSDAVILGAVELTNTKEGLYYA
jgi:glucokinase